MPLSDFNGSEQLDDLDGTTPRAARIDFGHDGVPGSRTSSSILTFFFSHIVFPSDLPHCHRYSDELSSRCVFFVVLVLRMTAPAVNFRFVTVIISEGIGIKTNSAPKVHAQLELKISNFLNYNQGRYSISTVVPMPLKDSNHEAVLEFSMSLSGMKELFDLIQDDWREPKNIAQQLDLCFDRFKKSHDYFKSLANEANSKALLQKAIAHATFADVVNTSLAFHETSVKISILEARGLMAMDSNGFSDPYCVLILRNLSSGHELYSDKTPIVNTSTNPRWNWSKIYALQSASVLEIRCLDRDLGMVDDFLGCAYIDLSDLRSQGASQDMWLPLCDEPSHDNKHAAMRLYSLSPNHKRGQVSIELRISTLLFFTHTFHRYVYSFNASIL
jgi:hypothetical protein